MTSLDVWGGKYEEVTGEAISNTVTACESVVRRHHESAASIANPYRVIHEDIKRKGERDHG